MKVTRISYSHQLTASKYDQLSEIARRLGILRSEIWNEYGSLKGVGIRQRTIRDWLIAEEKDFGVPARLWKETLRDIFDNIVAYREAAKVEVRKEIWKRTSKETDKKKQKKIQKELFGALKWDRWITVPYLRRRMRKHFRHGHTKVRNQIVLDKQCYKAFEHRGRAWIEVMSLVPRKRIAIHLNTTRKPTGTIRLLLRAGKVEVHYTVEDEKACSNRPCGEAFIGVDKGYTEVFTDSDGERYGEGLGDILSSESDYLKVKYQRRNKLRAIAEKKPYKASRITQNNLGRKKLEERKRKHTANVKNVVYKAAHKVVDKAEVIGAEDLSSPIKSKKKRSKDMKRRLSGWVKGLMALALLQVSQRRGASLVLVNSSYTSQMDSRYGVLLGDRKGNLFYCFDGVVLDSDQNAALNIRDRIEDSEISLWTSYQQVKSILLERTEQWRKHQRLGLLNQDSSCILRDINGERITDNFFQV